jgi:hypothetical protein
VTIAAISDLLLTISFALALHHHIPLTFGALRPPSNIYAPRAGMGLTGHFLCLPVVVNKLSCLASARTVGLVAVQVKNSLVQKFCL